MLPQKVRIEVQMVPHDAQQNRRVAARPASEPYFHLLLIAYPTYFAQ